MKRVMFIGQAMPRYKKHPHDWPTLNVWLYSIGLGDEHIKSYFFYSALVDYFPGSKGGSHVVPRKEEIAKERERLVGMIRDFKPEVVVPIGKLSISYCLNEIFGSLSEHIGKSYTADPYQSLGSTIQVIPLPHPSGASTWRHKPENKKLLVSALELLKKAIS